jgi:hypothetical protein
MTESSDKRHGPDRRRFSRGGRREGDVRGYTPLVFVVDPRPSGRDACEAILAKLRFAVAPFDSLDKAKRAMEGLKPDLVLVAKADLEELRRSLPPGRKDGPVPILPLPEGELSMTTLIDEVRRALRAGFSAIAES